MTKEELKEKIALLIRQGVIDGKLSLTMAEEILALVEQYYREAGWKSEKEWADYTLMWLKKILGQYEYEKLLLQIKEESHD